MTFLESSGQFSVAWGILMSGRSGYRKTDRRLDPEIRYRRARNRRAQGRLESEHRLVFLLPPTLAFAVGEGRHRHGIDVLPGPTVEAKGVYLNYIFRSVADFLREIATGHPAFSLSAVMIANHASSPHVACEQPFRIYVRDGCVTIETNWATGRRKVAFEARA